MAPIMSTLALGLACATLTSAHKLPRPSSFGNSTTTAPVTPSNITTPPTHPPATTPAGALVQLSPHHFPPGPLPDFHVPAALMAQLDDIECIHAGASENGWDCFGILKPGLSSLSTYTATATATGTEVVVLHNQPGDEGVVVETPGSLVWPSEAGVWFGNGSVSASSRKMETKARETRSVAQQEKATALQKRREVGSSWVTRTVASRTHPVNAQVTGAGGLGGEVVGDAGGFSTAGTAAVVAADGAGGERGR